MKTYADNTKEKPIPSGRIKSQSGAEVVFSNQKQNNTVFQFTDNRPEASTHKKLQEKANNSSQAKQVFQLQAMASQKAVQQRQLQGEESPESIQKKNNTGLPDTLKSGIENLSGYSMDDVKVHRNSDKPAQLHAHAFAQGTHIHLAPGQEKHLPHEAWHVVQQKQGRVKPTLQMKGSIPVNNDVNLEQEADRMGVKAMQFRASASYFHSALENSDTPNIIQRALVYESSASGYHKVQVNDNRPWWNSVDKYMPVGSSGNLARCHVISFEAIRLGVWQALVEYMYGSKKWSDFTGAINRLRNAVFPYGGTASTHTSATHASKLGTIANALYNHINTTLPKIQTATPAKQVAYADEIVLCMNSSPDNLRVADAKTNSSIGSGLDPRGWDIDTTKKDSSGKSIFVIKGVTAKQLRALGTNERQRLIELYKDDNEIQSSEKKNLLSNLMTGGGRKVYIDNGSGGLIALH
jgi:hypothetical protein